MTSDDLITIQAFTVILPQLETAMSNDLKQAVHAVGRSLAVADLEAAATTIRNLVEQHPCLQEPFAEAYNHLSVHYQAQLRGQEVQSFVPPDLAQEGLETVSLPILTAEDFAIAARSVLQQMRRNLWRFSEGTQAFLISLQRSLSEYDEQANAVLKAMEQQLLTIEDLAYAFGMPLDQARRMVQTLWNQGYIDSAKSGTLSRTLLPFTQPSRRQSSVEPGTHFVLTSKGYFHLHPLFARTRSRGTDV